MILNDMFLDGAQMVGESLAARPRSQAIRKRCKLQKSKRSPRRNHRFYGRGNMW
jgi:hypothetical protein